MKERSRWLSFIGVLGICTLVAIKVIWHGYPSNFEFSWDEEVQLHDGKVVVIRRGLLYERLGRWSRYENSIPRESKLRFTPAGDKAREVRFPHLNIMVFDVVDGVTYLVLLPTSSLADMPERSSFPIGEGQGNYRVLRWLGDEFVAIPLSELPAQIVARNLLLDSRATTASTLDGTLLTLLKKSHLNGQIGSGVPVAVKHIVRSSSGPAALGR